MKAQRIRFRYGLHAEACDLNQRELVTSWEEACRAAGLPLALSEGRRPSSQVSIAAPLPRGVTSGCELVDIFFAEPASPEDAVSRIAPHLSTGIVVCSAEEIGPNVPSLQSQVRWAEYEVTVNGIDVPAVRQSISSTLEARSLPSEYRREKKVREYDLRPLIIDLHLLAEPDGRAVLVMRLRAEPERTARADQVADALKLPEDRQIHRTRLVLYDVPAVVSAHRRTSERDED